MVYRVIDNKLYKGLAALILPPTPTGAHEWNASRLGDVLECLCWHAYEQGDYCFILELIWNSTNRCLLPAPRAAGAAAAAAEPSLVPPRAAAAAAGNQEAFGEDEHLPWSKRRWRWRASCQHCSRTEVSDWSFGKAPDKPPGWTKKLNTCPECIAQRQG